MKSHNLNPDEKKSRDRRLTRGWLCYIFFCLLILPMLIAGWTALGPYPLLGGITFIVLMLLTFSLLVVAESFFVPTSREVMSRDTRAPVVYLRPFDEDLRTVSDSVDTFLSPSGRSEEGVEDTLLPLNALGPLISIAEPGPMAQLGIQKIGAYRENINTSDWQAWVLELLDQAGMVVIAIGDSPGIEWEIIQVCNLTPLDSLLLFLPPIGNPANTSKDRELDEQAAYGQFKQLFEKHFDIELPPFTQTTYFIGFDASGQLVLPAISEKGEHWVDNSGEVVNAVREQLRTVLGHMRPGVNFDHYRIYGRAARRIRLGFGIVMFILGVPGSMFAVVWFSDLFL